MKINFHFDFFLKELVLFAGTMAAGLFIAYQYGILGHAPDQIQQVDFSWANILFTVIFFTLFTYILVTYKRVAESSFRILLLFVMFSGIELLAGIFVPFPYDTIIGVLGILLIVAIRSVWSHDLGVGLGIAGICAMLGLSISPMAAALLLAFLSVYDIIAVYKTRHMVQLARGMIQSGAIFGFIIPFHWADFGAGRDNAQPGEKFMILGSGDIGLPVVLVASIVPQSFTAALVVAVFACVGLFLTHIIFTNQTRRMPMAALPPIATLSIIGYLVAQIFI